MKLKQEILAVGTWNDIKITLSDLRNIVTTFFKFGDLVKVPLKLGHNEEQEVTDGQPALGWVTELEVIEEKLIATFEDVPEIIHKAFKKKLYRNVSVELDRDVEHKNIKYDFVLSAVALLGADIPAVNVLNDLAAFMSAARNSDLAKHGYTAHRHVTFNTITGKNRGVSTMTPEDEVKLRQEIAELKAAGTTAAAKFTVLETSSKADKEKYEAEKEQFEKDQKKIKVDTARSVFTKLLEDAVKDKAITPAQRELFTKVLRLDDDDAVLDLKEEDVKALFDAEDDKGKFSKPSGKEGDDDDHDDPAGELTTQTYEYMSKNGEKDFTVAMFSVMRANPELHVEYIHSNGEVKQ